MSSRLSFIAELFTMNPGARDQEPQIAEMVSESVLACLHRDQVNAGGSQQELYERFRSTDIPSDPIRFDEYFQIHISDLLQNSVNLHSPRCLGHMTGVLPQFVHRLSAVITSLNQNMVKWESSRAFTLMERQTIAMLHRLVFGESEQFYREHVQASESTLGVMASGGTAANITALWCARNACFGPRDSFGGIQYEGLGRSLDAYGYRDAVVLASSMAHYSIEKAAVVLGLGARHIIRIPVDEAGCLCPDALRETIEGCQRHRRRVLAIVGVAGTTDSGCIDPLGEIAQIAASSGIHFHVDAAWGAPLLLTERLRSMLRGIERADSVTIDGHKQLHLPLGTSILLLKDPHLARQIEHEAEYMLRPNCFDQGRYTLEGSRASTILFFNAALHLIGRHGFDALVEGHVRRAAEFAEMVNEAVDFELLCRPQTNIVLYRYLPRFARAAASHNGDRETELDEFNEQLQQAQFERGVTFVSRTRLRCLPQFHSHPVVALRAVINHPLTSRADLGAVLDDQRSIAAEMQNAISMSD